MILENAWIRVDVGNVGDFSIWDNVSELGWKNPDFQNHSGRLTAEYHGKVTDFTLGSDPRDVKIQQDQTTAAKSVVIEFTRARNEQRSIDIQLLIRLSVEKEEPRVNLQIESLVLPIGYEFSELAYPSCLISLLTAKEDGYLVVPKGSGCIVPTNLAVGFMRYMHNIWANIADITQVLPFGGGGGGCMSMSWCGAYKHKDGRGSGLFANVLTDDDAALEVVCNSVKGEVKKVGPLGEPREVGRGARISAMTPVWKSSLGEFRYTRGLILEIIPNGTYVEMAKRYREYVRVTGRLKLFTEKLSENPNIERIIGAPNVKIFVAYNRMKKPELRSWDGPVLDGYRNILTSFTKAKKIISDLSKMGIDRALISIEGWQQDGFCNKHPDIWPPHEPAGGLRGLKEICRLATNKGYLVALDDNYQDFFANAPSRGEIERVALRNRDGSSRMGGIWSGGPVIRICSSQALEFANRNLDVIQRELDPNAHYLDTVAATPPVECFSMIHPMTRAQDTKNRKRLLKSLKKRGLVAGAEFGTDWAVPVCDYFEGLPGEAVGYYHPLIAPGFGIRVPLFQLVYHDAVICYWQHGMPYGREDHIDHFLADLIQGNPSYWVVTNDHWLTMKNLLRTTYEVVSKLHRQTAMIELVGHEILSDDYYIQKSRYADGTTVAVNFGIVDRETEEGEFLPSKGFIIKRKDGEIRGSFSRNCTIETNNTKG